MSFADNLILWYQSNRRDLPWRQTSDPYRIWVSEIMLQQTRVAAVLPRYERFISRFPDLRSLAEADEDDLRKLWEGLGYYSRASNLRRAAIRIREDYSGEFPSAEEQLLKLPGIGPYTAAAVSSIAFGVPAAAVDGNVLRVWSRLKEDPRDLSSPSVRKDVKHSLEAVIPEGRAGDFNSAMMDLGATVCLPAGTPLCADCPVSGFCMAHASGTVSMYPVQKKKPARRTVCKSVFVLLTPSGAPLVYRRPETGLLAGLWQLPDLECHTDESGFLSFLSENGLRPEGEILRYAKTHIFTHQEWNMRVYCTSVSGIPPLSWVPLTENMALPTAYRICLPD